MATRPYRGRASHFLSRGFGDGDGSFLYTELCGFDAISFSTASHPKASPERRRGDLRNGSRAPVIMAAFPTIPGEDPTAPDLALLHQPCRQCFIALFCLALFTGVFMVTSLVLSFKVCQMSHKSRPRRVVPTAPPAMDFWASRPISHSQSTLLMVEEPAPNPRLVPAYSSDWDEIIARQPRVTLQDLGEFWWRSNATAV